jgi:hypothetical protein
MVGEAGLEPAKAYTRRLVRVNKTASDLARLDALNAIAGTRIAQASQANGLAIVIVRSWSQKPTWSRLF